jgi:hypothetical protein
MSNPRDEIEREIGRVEDEMMSSDDSRYEDLQSERDALEEARSEAESQADIAAEQADGDEYPEENLPND